MKLKIFVPDWDNDKRNRYCTPLLYPFLPLLSSKATIEKYGSWTNEIMLAESLQDCDVAMLKYEISYYYTFKKIAQLKAINTATTQAGKLLICTVKSDAGITPPLQHFHLYRSGGLASKNKGNQFAIPVFIADPLPVHNGGKLFIHTQKTAKPLVGFCGQGKAGITKLGKDLMRNMYYRIIKLLGKRFDDNDALISSTYIRSQLLGTLEQSPLIDTCFIRYKKYRNGIISKEERATAAGPFFQNILDTQYTLCYRGAGNFSVRLFETLACGRIPIIVMSNNLLPLPDKIEWNRFPVIQSSERKTIAQKMALFHNNLSEEEFAALQLYARQVWEAYLTYPAFMRAVADKYITTIAIPSSAS